MRKSEVNMLSGPIVNGLLAMILPVMVMNVTQNLFNIIDMTVLSRFANEAAVGAVGASGTLMTLFTTLLSGRFALRLYSVPPSVPFLLFSRVSFLPLCLPIRR